MSKEFILEKYRQRIGNQKMALLSDIIYIAMDEYALSFGAFLKERTPAELHKFTTQELHEQFIKMS